MAYATVSEFKSYKSITTTNAGDDTIIGNLLDAASAYIDRFTGRTFTAVSATRYFDCPTDRELWLDDELLTITTLTNGDGTTLSGTTDYILIPANTTPKYAVKIRQSSSKWWQPNSSGETEQVISIAGTWGYSTTAPADIKDACLEIAGAIYARRSGQGESGASVVTTAGVVITPKDIPDTAYQIIKNYRRFV